MKTKQLSIAVIVAWCLLMLACSNTNDKPAANPVDERQSKPATDVAPPEPKPVSAVPADLQVLYGKKCAFCHGKEARGGAQGPNILAEDDKHSADEWTAYLKNPKVFSKKNRMPKPKLTDDEAKQLGTWLATAVGSEKGAQAEKAHTGEAAGKKTLK